MGNEGIKRAHTLCDRINPVFLVSGGIPEYPGKPGKVRNTLKGKRFLFLADFRIGIL